MTRGTRAILLDVYERLYAKFGPRHWWPAKTEFEVVVGAILTQNTTWANVERALAGLRTQGLLEFPALRRAPESKLRELIRPAGYYNQKSRYLAGLMAFLDGECGGDLERLFAGEQTTVRAKLLAQRGIGPETADSILLYAGRYPVFVVDAYTFRVFSRLKLGPSDRSYDAVQAFFMKHLPRDAPLYNEYHALIVALGKQVCKKRPLCTECPLEDLPCPTAREQRKERASPPRRRSRGGNVRAGEGD